MLRAYEPAMTQPLPVSIIVTLRPLDGNPNVRVDGIRPLTQTNWFISRLRYALRSGCRLALGRISEMADLTGQVRH